MEPEALAREILEWFRARTTPIDVVYRSFHDPRYTYWVCVSGHVNTLTLVHVWRYKRGTGWFTRLLTALEAEPIILETNSIVEPRLDDFFARRPGWERCAPEWEHRYVRKIQGVPDPGTLEVCEV